MSLESNSFLSDLIGTGSDASLNLFKVSVVLKQGSNENNNFFTLRITDAPNIITRDSSTVPIPYQNINIDRLSSGTSITKTQTIIVRVDDKYNILKTLRNLQCIDDNGSFYMDSSKEIFEIRIDSYRNSSTDTSFDIAYTWSFYNCYITGITPLNFGYESSNPATVNVTFVWGSYKEG